MLVYCLVQCVLYGCQGINYPETYEASKFLVVGYLLLLVSRELLARMAEYNPNPNPTHPNLQP